MTKKASSQALEELHASLATVLAQRVKSDGVTASDLNVARQFLKDNHIDALATKDNPLGKLIDSLPFPDADGVEAEGRLN